MEKGLGEHFKRARTGPSTLGCLYPRRGQLYWRCRLNPPQVNAVTTTSKYSKNASQAYRPGSQVHAVAATLKVGSETLGTLTVEGPAGDLPRARNGLSYLGCLNQLVMPTQPTFCECLYKYKKGKRLAQYSYQGS